MPDFGKMDFPDLKRRLEDYLEAIKTVPDLDRLLQMLNPMLKAEGYSAEERATLRRLRQKAYDRKRHPKFQMAAPTQMASEQSKIQMPDPAVQTNSSEVQVPNLSLIKTAPSLGEPMPILENSSSAINAYPKRESFGEGALRALYSINGEHFVKTAPKLLTWFTGAALVSFFLWKQSLALYESAGFAESMWASAGGILMIVGFAAYHSITRSMLALLLCLYANGYEAYLMISGTLENELQIQIQTIQSNPDLVFLKEKASKSLAHYQELKQRYDNPESKVFKNDWFLKNHLNPAWQESVADHDELVTKESALTSVNQSGHITWLKIFYRLGLVFLCMMLVHQFFAVWTNEHDSRAVER